MFIKSDLTLNSLVLKSRETAHQETLQDVRSYHSNRYLTAKIGFVDKQCMYRIFCCFLQAVPGYTTLD